MGRREQLITPELEFVETCNEAEARLQEAIFLITAAGFSKAEVWEWVDQALSERLGKRQKNPEQELRRLLEQEIWLHQAKKAKLLSLGFSKK